jgi:putative serine/threonine protein kinase
MESERSSQTPSEHASLEEATRAPFIQVLTYPRISLRVAKQRVKQLRELGVEELIFEGHAKVGRLGILGLGTVGVVVRAKAGGSVRALKIRRTDANRPNMEQENRMARLANRVGVGPAVYAHTKDMILMQLLEYQELSDWIRGLRGPGTRSQVRSMLHGLLNQCRTLDIMGIDHGQLSNLRKHAVIADGRPWIIDFESAGTGRRTKNVTTAAQYLLVGGALSPAVRRAIGLKETVVLRRLLSDYKQGLSDFDYSKILEHLRLVVA